MNIIYNHSKQEAVLKATSISATGGRGEMRSISEARRDHTHAAAELSKQQEAVLKATSYET
jgi:hypothetical protein